MLLQTGYCVVLLRCGLCPRCVWLQLNVHLRAGCVCLGGLSVDVGHNGMRASMGLVQAGWLHCLG